MGRAEPHAIGRDNAVVILLDVDMQGGATRHGRAQQQQQSMQGLRVVEWKGSAHDQANAQF